jgi:hypothetical protein
MEQVLDAPVKVTPIYKFNQVALATFLGGPLAGGYVIAENFKAFNEPEKVRKTWIYATLTTIGLFSAAYFLPNRVPIPTHLLPLIIAVAANFITKQTQGAKIDTHVNAGLPVYGWGRTIGIALVAVLITVAIFVLVLLLMDLTALS